MRPLFARHSGLFRYVVGDAVSMLGDWFTYVAVGWVAMTGPHGLLGVALVQLAHTSPQVVVAPLAGWLADRFDRRAILVLASVGRGVVTLAMAAALDFDRVALLEALLFLRMSGAAITGAASRAAVRALVSDADVAAVNRVLETSWSFFFAAGVALGGLVSGWLGPMAALSIDALTFLVAALVFAGLRALPPSESPAPTRAHSRVLQSGHVRLALAKTPMMLLSGGCWVLLHATALSTGVVGLGAFHAVRAVAGGAAPWALRRSRPLAMVVVGTLVGGLGALALLVPQPLAWVSACAAWGFGMGAAWVGASTRLMRGVPGPLLGRYAALDIASSNLATALGGLVMALLLVSSSGYVAVASLLGLAALVAAILAGPRLLGGRAVVLILLLLTMAAGWVSAPVARAQPALRAELRARAVTDDAFVHRVLFSWTTSEQAEELRQGRRLLSRGASDGAQRSPYQRALELVRGGSAEAVLAGHLAERPRRYAWPTPYGTVIPRGSRPYGPVLVRIEVRRDAWYARFSPESPRPFEVLDEAGRAVPLDRVAEDPSRVAVVFHTREDPRLGPYREYVVHGAVRSFELGTERTALRWRDDLDLLARLRRHLPRAHRGSVAPYWRAAAQPDGLVADYARTLPFDTARHRPGPATLASLERALASNRPRGAPWTVTDPPP